MSQPSFILKFFSTMPVQRDRLVAFASFTKTLFGGRRLSGEFTLGTRDSKAVEFGDLGIFFDQNLPKWTGCLSVSFSNEAGLSGRCDLLQLRRKNRASRPLGDIANYRTHEFQIEIDADHRSHAWMHRALFEYFGDVVDLLDAQFAAAHDNDRFLGPGQYARGLEAGLPDIYRMTAFGRAFVDLIGTDRLLKLPVTQAKLLRNGAVAIQLDEDLGNAAAPDVPTKRALVRETVGLDYFANPGDPTVGMGSLRGGQIGFWTFVGAILKTKREGDSPKRLAERHPAIDWSGVFADN